MNNSVKNFSVMNPCCFRKASGKPIALSRDEAMLINEEIKPIAVSIVELCLAEGIS